MRLAPPGRSPAWTVLSLAILVTALSMVFATAVPAKPFIRTSFFNAYPSAVGSVLDNLPSHSNHCGVCHFDFNGGGPRNPFGRRVESVVKNLNTDAQRVAAIHSIENEDPDGDGWPSLAEFQDNQYANTPTFPGLVPAIVDSTSNVPVLSEITPYLVPTNSVDGTPPVVNVTSPAGGESWVGGSAHSITWNATDNVGVSSVDVYWHDAASSLWTPILLNGANSGSVTWFVPDMPTTNARVMVVAWDEAANAGRDSNS